MPLRKCSSWALIWPERREWRKRGRCNYSPVRGEAGTFSEANCYLGSQTHAQDHAFCVKLCAVAGSPLLFVPDQGGRPYLVLTSQNGMRLPKSVLDDVGVPGIVVRGSVFDAEMEGACGRSGGTVNSRTIPSRAALVASLGTRSLSCKWTPRAPVARRAAISSGGRVGRTKSSKGSRPRFYHRPEPQGKTGRLFLVGRKECSWSGILLVGLTFNNAFVKSKWVSVRAGTSECPVAATSEKRHESTKSLVCTLTAAIE